jgi:hypothetical protein
VEGIAVGVLTADFHAIDRDFFHAPLIHLLREIRERDIGFFGTARAHLYDFPEEESRDQNHHPEQDGFNCGIHL